MAVHEFNIKRISVGQKNKFSFSKIAALVIALSSSIMPVSAYNKTGKVPVVQISEYSSSDFNDLLNTTAKISMEYTSKTGFEACARICKTETGFKVNITSNMSHVGCQYKDDDCQPENRLETIHSHPKHRAKFVMNDNDKEFLLARKGSSMSDYLAPGEKSARHNSKDFSKQDISSGSGYMVDQDGVIHYQNGPGTSKPVSKIK